MRPHPLMPCHKISLLQRCVHLCICMYVCMYVCMQSYWKFFSSLLLLQLIEERQHLLATRRPSCNKKCVVIDLDETLVHSSFKVSTCITNKCVLSSDVRLFPGYNDIHGLDSRSPMCGRNVAVIMNIIKTIVECYNFGHSTPTDDMFSCTDHA